MVDITQFCLILFMVLTGVLQGWILEKGEGYRGGRGLISPETFLGIDRHTSVTLHKWVGIALAVFITLHIILHWGWIIEMTKRMFLRR